MAECTKAEREWLDVMKLAGGADGVIAESDAGERETIINWPDSIVFQRAEAAWVALVNEWKSRDG